MPFPQSDRVEYQRNPLVEVVCQLRFPPILKLAESLPADYQDRIRGDFPEFEQRRVGLELPPGLPDAVREQAVQVLAAAAPAAHNEYAFFDPERRWRVGLTQSFIALSTPGYSSWEEFNGRLDVALDPFEEMYRPAYYQRVGLRYRDLIVRSELGIEPDRPWSELLKPHVLGEMASQDIDRQILDAKRELLVELDDAEGRVRVRHGLTTVTDDEVAYVIDADFFAEGQLDGDAARSSLKAFNKRAGRLFRWFIEDALHTAMCPVPVEEE